MLLTSDIRNTNIEIGVFQSPTRVGPGTATAASRPDFPEKISDTTPTESIQFGIMYSRVNKQRSLFDPRLSEADLRTRQRRVAANCLILRT